MEDHPFISETRTSDRNEQPKPAASSFKTLLQWYKGLFSRTMRNPVACVACRTAKRQCIHKDRPPCKRCKDRSEHCYFPPPGTSSLHRQPKDKRTSHRDSLTQSTSLSPQAEDVAIKRIGGQVSQLLNTADSSSQDLSKTDPFGLFTDEVKNSYLRCSYKWSFHHIPSLLDRVRKETLEVWVIWSILALAIRFSIAAVPPFSSPIEASNAYAAHARSILLPAIEEPTVSRIQALLMITGHSWGAGEGRRAWMYLGMAVRMAQVIGLFDESPPARTRDEFVAAEEKRRTAWTCFLMDSLLSGGKGRRRSLSSDDMRIALPCDSENFNFGEPVICERLNGALMDEATTTPIGKLGIVSHSMRVADTWGGVARWACSSEVEDQLPWHPESEIQVLLKSLDRWRLSLPPRLQYSVFSLHAHSASDQGQAYCYMHSIYFMSIMFLHRSYLPYVPEGDADRMHATGSSLDAQWLQWKSQSRKELLRTADQVCEMLEEMRSFGLFFLRGLVPWIGFTAYTAVGTILYYYHFPAPEDNKVVLERARDRVVNGCAFLKDMRGSWPMADTWRETIKQMQIFYSNIKTKGEQGVTRNERQEMRNAIIDYGALQPSPVHEHQLDPEGGLGFRSPPNTDERSESASPLPAAVNDIPPISRRTQEDFLSTDFDMFDTNFSLNDADLEAAIADATQGFWANFPGEMEIY